MPHETEKKPMDALITLKDNQAGENALTPELTKLYGGPFVIGDIPADRPRIWIGYVKTIDGAISFNRRGLMAGGLIADGSVQDKLVLVFEEIFGDAIFVGPGTLIEEGNTQTWNPFEILPELAPQLRELRKQRGMQERPLIVIPTNSGKLMPKEGIPRIFNEPGHPVMVVTNKTGYAVAMKELENVPHKPNIVTFGEDPATVEFPALFQYLRTELNIKVALLEAGPRLNGVFQNNGWFDDFFLTVVPNLIGAQNRLFINDGYERTPDNPIRLEIVSEKEHDSYRFFRYRRRAA